MKVRVLQMAGQDCEPVSFARLMGELKPIDYSQLAGTVVLDEDEWDEWREDLAHAHEREIEIERKCSADAYFRGVNDATDAVFDSATDDLLAERGLVRLPVDADGEYIREHDKVDWRDHAGTWHENATVVAVCDDGCYVMDRSVFHVHKSDIRHHHAPTVEDVLREFADEMNQNLGMYTGEAIDADEWRDADAKTVEKFAAKLRLAGENA